MRSRSGGRGLDPKSGREKSRARLPEIRILLPRRPGYGPEYAKAHIREKSGGYRYLVWREFERVRSIYLGRLRVPCPTRRADHGAGAAGLAVSAGELRCRPKKQVRDRAEESARCGDGLLGAARSKRRGPVHPGSRRSVQVGAEGFFAGRSL